MELVSMYIVSVTPQSADRWTKSQEQVNTGNIDRLTDKQNLPNLVNLIYMEGKFIDLLDLVLYVPFIDCNYIIPRMQHADRKKLFSALTVDIFQKILHAALYRGVSGLMH